MITETFKNFDQKISHHRSMWLKPWKILSEKHIASAKNQILLLSRQGKIVPLLARDNPFRTSATSANFWLIPPMGWRKFQPRTFEPHAWTPDLSILDFSTTDFSTQDLGMKSPGLRSLGLKSSWLKSLELKSPGLKSSWLKNLGLKGLGLKLGVEKSGVEISFNP